MNNEVVVFLQSSSFVLQFFLPTQQLFFAKNSDFYYAYISAARCRRLLIFKPRILNTVRSKILSLQFEKFTLSGCKDIRIIVCG